MGAALLSIRIVLAAVFFVAATGKLIDLGGTRIALSEFGVPERFAGLAMVALPLAELAVCACLAVDPAVRYGAGGAFALLVAFIAGVTRVIARGGAPDCHCFGQLHSEPAGVWTVVRNLFLALLAIVVIAGGEGRSLPGGVAHLSAAQVVLAAAVALAIPLALFGAGRFAGRRRRAGAAELDAVAVDPDGLAPGSAAPGFALRPIRGDASTLADLLAAGRPLLLVFANSTCGSCHKLLESCARWQEPLGGAVTLAAIVSGESEAAERLVGEYGLNAAMGDPGGATAAVYRVVGAPSAVLIDRAGTIASLPVNGPEAIEALLRWGLRRQDARLSVSG